MLKKYSIVVIALVFMFVGCATMGAKDVRPWTELTPKEKATFLMDLYGKQYDSYLQLYKKPNKTEAEKEVLRQKYDWITKVYPYIDVYAGYAENGVLAPAETEALMIQLINEALGI